MKTPQKKKIIVLSDWFYPGYKAGGPIQSCRNFAAFMEDTYDLYVITSDRDLGDIQPYPGITVNTWNQYSANTKVFYAAALSFRLLQQLQQDVGADYMYLNSMFSPRFAIYPLILKLLGKIRAEIMLAPRGMLKKSALAFKPAKKKFFLFLFGLLGIYRQIHFHATDAREETDIRQIIGTASVITRIPNFPGVQETFTAPVKKSPGSLSMIFVGRIHSIKNLDFILQCLLRVSASINFTIVGAVEDEEYWQQCRQLIEKLPSNITVNIKNDVPHGEMNAILEQHHLFVLPTQGENFGHAIFESLASGRPVLISDQTPWKNLELCMAGWDLPLQNPHLFTAVIEKVAAMSHEEHIIWCRGAWQYCNDFIKNAGIKEQYIKLFN